MLQLGCLLRIIGYWRAKCGTPAPEKESSHQGNDPCDLYTLPGEIQTSPQRYMQLIYLELISSQGPQHYHEHLLPFGYWIEQRLRQDWLQLHKYFIRHAKWEYCVVAVIWGCLLLWIVHLKFLSTVVGAVYILLCFALPAPLFHSGSG